MKAKPNGVLLMIGSREGLVRARREDVKDIWEAVRDEFIVEMQGKNWNKVMDVENQKVPGKCWRRSWI